MLSEKAREIFRFIIRSTRERGYPPTLREIGEAFHIHSTNGVRFHLGVLEREGYVRRNSRISRGLEVLESGLRRYTRHFGPLEEAGEGAGAEGIPILGRVAAGTPLLASENLEGRLDLEESFPSREPRFALRVRGDSMRDAGILEDDLVVVRKTNHAEDGEVVVALLGDEATVKRLRRRRDRAELVAANPSYDPIVVRAEDELCILGVVIGVVRQARALRRNRRRAG